MIYIVCEYATTSPAQSRLVYPSRVSPCGYLVGEKPAQVQGFQRYEIQLVSNAYDRGRGDRVGKWDRGLDGGGTKPKLKPHQDGARA